MQRVILHIVDDGLVMCVRSSSMERFVCRGELGNVPAAQSISESGCTHAALTMTVLSDLRYLSQDDQLHVDSSSVQILLSCAR